MLREPVQTSTRQAFRYTWALAHLKENGGDRGNAGSEGVHAMQPQNMLLVIPPAFCYFLKKLFFSYFETRNLVEFENSCLKWSVKAGSIHESQGFNKFAFHPYTLCTLILNAKHLDPRQLASGRSSLHAIWEHMWLPCLDLKNATPAPCLTAKAFWKQLVYGPGERDLLLH